MPELPHFDADGHAHMVNVSGKPATHRVAVASGLVVMAPATLQRILNRQMAKGDVLELARIAGIMAAKRTAELIPLCHPLMLDSVELDLQALGIDTVQVTSRVETNGRTGVEMEALTATMGACLTIYDMCKSVDRAIRIDQVQLEEKLGGKSGHYQRQT